MDCSTHRRRSVGPGMSPPLFRVEGRISNAGGLGDGCVCYESNVLPTRNINMKSLPLSVTVFTKYCEFQTFAL